MSFHCSLAVEMNCKSYSMSVSKSYVSINVKDERKQCLTGTFLISCQLVHANKKKTFQSDL